MRPWGSTDDKCGECDLCLLGWNSPPPNRLRQWGSHCTRVGSEANYFVLPFVSQNSWEGGFNEYHCWFKRLWLFMVWNLITNGYQNICVVNHHYHVNMSISSKGWSRVERMWLMWLGTKMLQEEPNHHKHHKKIHMELDEDS